MAAQAACGAAGHVLQWVTARPGTSPPVPVFNPEKDLGCTWHGRTLMCQPQQHPLLLVASLPPSSGHPSSGTSICRQCSVTLSSWCTGVRGLFCRNVLIPSLSLQKESRNKGTAVGILRKLQPSCQGWVCQERHCRGCGVCMFILLDLFLRRAQRQPLSGARGPTSREGRVAMSYKRTSQILPCSLSHTPKPGGALQKELRRRTTQIGLILEE